MIPEFINTGTTTGLNIDHLCIDEGKNTVDIALITRTSNINGIPVNEVVESKSANQDAINAPMLLYFNIDIKAEQQRA